MTQPRILRFYLEDGLRQSAETGQHNFIAKLVAVAETAGYRVSFHPATPTETIKSAGRPGYSMFHMEDPPNERALTFRRVYYYPFWAIEPSAKRWEWRVSRAEFSPRDVPRQRADKFYKFWQNRLFQNALAGASRDGFIYVPLQGRLLDHRSFQLCSPLDMLRQVLAHDTRPIIAGLHPKESYSDAELGALDDLCVKNPRLSVRSGDMEALLMGCDYVVTQNSAAGFAGYFFGKPLVLFGQIDFHHIAAKVSVLGVKDALRQAPEMTPDYAGYIHWFWQVMSINAGRPEAEDKIRNALARAGWPV